MDDDSQIDSSQPNPNLASFYYIAEDYGQVKEEEISPSMHAVSQIAQRYQSPEFLAKGGMKQVFKVYDANCKRHVAMATLLDDAPLELCDPLIHEAWLTALLDHPNIIKIHDVGVDARNRPYFTMDLKAGDSLRSLLKRLKDPDSEEEFSLARLLQVFIKVCNAVAYAHSVQVIHLDLKPANIQVGQFGEVLVCDWGLGRVQKRDDGIEFERLLLNSDLLSSNTLFGEVRGTPGYMAPEQIEQDLERDQRTDIYQLGCILYSILTLERPVEGEPQEAIARAAAGEVVPPRQRTPQRKIPASLEAVVMKAMALKPSDRYQSVELLEREVSRYLTGYATEAEEASLLTQIGLLWKRNLRLFNTVFCSALLLMASAIWFYWQLALKEHQKSVALTHAEQTLALYEAGKSAKDRLASQNAKAVELAVIEMHLTGDNMTPERALLDALNRDPENPMLNRSLAEHYFIVQRFNQAKLYFGRGEKRHEADRLIARLAEEYAEIKPDDDAQLTTEQMVRLLRSIKNFNGFEAMVLISDQNIRVDPIQRAAVIKEHLRSLNPNWNGWFDYDHEISRLRVGGPGLERLSESGSILAGLQPKHLDISGSSIRELWKETRYGIETLDIRGCPIADTNVLRRFLYLKVLVIQPGQFSRGQLDFLPDHVQVIERSGFDEIDLQAELDEIRNK